MTRWGERSAPDPDGLGASDATGGSVGAPLGGTGLSGAADLAGIESGLPESPVVVGGAVDSDDDEPATRPDVIGVIAVGVGFAGIVLFGLLAALIAGVLGGLAGQRAREAGRPLDLAYLAIGLAALDGVVWVALHLLFDIPVQLG